jgi:hypothetical protein
LFARLRGGKPALHRSISHQRGNILIAHARSSCLGDGTPWPEKNSLIARVYVGVRVTTPVVRLMHSAAGGTTGGNNFLQVQLPRDRAVACTGKDVRDPAQEQPQGSTRFRQRRYKARHLIENFFCKLK